MDGWINGYPSGDWLEDWLEDWLLDEIHNNSPPMHCYKLSSYHTFLLQMPRFKAGQNKSPEFLRTFEDMQQFLEGLISSTLAVFGVSSGHEAWSAWVQEAFHQNSLVRWHAVLYFGRAFNFTVPAR